MRSESTSPATSATLGAYALGCKKQQNLCTRNKSRRTFTTRVGSCPLGASVRWVSDCLRFSQPRQNTTFQQLHTAKLREQELCVAGTRRRARDAVHCRIQAAIPASQRTGGFGAHAQVQVRVLNHSLQARGHPRFAIRRNRRVHLYAARKRNKK